MFNQPPILGGVSLGNPLQAQSFVAYTLRKQGQIATKVKFVKQILTRSCMIMQTNLCLPKKTNKKKKLVLVTSELDFKLFPQPGKMSLFPALK